mmetsp:Transcript_61429/g.146451  ORF Transcript_61429/g.146451 Transcript_61429/m.146451 type:complete len:99 (+) Transcript_61429:2037-2333(+)
MSLQTWDLSARLRSGEYQPPQRCLDGVLAIPLLEPTFPACSGSETATALEVVACISRSSNVLDAIFMASKLWTAAIYMEPLIDACMGGLVMRCTAAMY